MEVTKEYYRGYLKLHDNRDFLKLDNGEYKFMVYSTNHMYLTVKETDCYDAKGNYLGVYKEEKNHTKTETKEIENQKVVVQIDYDFKLLPIGACYNQSEIYEGTKLLEKEFNIKDAECYDNRINIEEYIRIYNGDNTKTIHYKENFTPFEICKIGYSANITNKTNKTLSLSIKDYTRSKDEFVKNNPRHEDVIEYIYNANIGYLCLFWGVSRNVLLKDNFNRNDKAFKKLNKRIKQKIKL